MFPLLQINLQKSKVSFSMFSSLRQPKKTHRVSRDTKTEGNRRFPRFPVLSPVPMIGKGFGKRFEAPSYEEGDGVDGKRQNYIHNYINYVYIIEIQMVARFSNYMTTT